MPLSHHSHSGQFCRHAKHSLQAMVQTAQAQGLAAFALSEHMPRDEPTDLYPEERDAGLTPESLARTFDAYVAEAQRLKQQYASDAFRMAVGFEAEWIRASSAALVQHYLRTYALDFFIGSVHHVHSIPIDFDRPMYEAARQRSGGSDVQLFVDYYDSQWDMLQSLCPPVVGHFDLIRLLSDDPNAALHSHSLVWPKIQRNLDFIAHYGGLLEVNAAALRKGLREPYPAARICAYFKSIGGEFTLSDDCHATDQVATHYPAATAFLKQLGIESVAFIADKHSRLRLPVR